MIVRKHFSFLLNRQPDGNAPRSMQIGFIASCEMRVGQTGQAPGSGMV
jgi:hypothetical protein